MARIGRFSNRDGGNTIRAMSKHESYKNCGFEQFLGIDNQQVKEELKDELK